MSKLTTCPTVHLFNDQSPALASLRGDCVLRSPEACASYMLLCRFSLVLLHLYRHDVLMRKFQSDLHAPGFDERHCLYVLRLSI